MSENIHEICGNKKFMNIGAKQRKKKHSEHTYDEMEKINIKKMVSSYLINQAFRPSSFSKKPSF